MSVEDEIRGLLAKDVGLAWSGDLTNEYRLIEGGVLDSMGIFQLVSAIENHYGIQVADDDIIAENFETVSAIARLVSSKET